MAAHLLKTEENEHVEVHEIRGFTSNKLNGALHEAYAVKFHPNGATRFRSNGATLKRKFSGSDRVYYLPFLCCFSSCSFIGLGER